MMPCCIRASQDQEMSAWQGIKDPSQPTKASGSLIPTGFPDALGFQGRCRQRCIKGSVRCPKELPSLCRNSVLQALRVSYSANYSLELPSCAIHDVCSVYWAHCHATRNLLVLRLQSFREFHSCPDSRGRPVGA